MSVALTDKFQGVAKFVDKTFISAATVVTGISAGATAAMTLFPSASIWTTFNSVALGLTTASPLILGAAVAASSIYLALKAPSLFQRAMQKAVRHAVEDSVQKAIKSPSVKGAAKYVVSGAQYDKIERTVGTYIFAKTLQDGADVNIGQAPEKPVAMEDLDKVEVAPEDILESVDVYKNSLDTDRIAYSVKDLKTGEYINFVTSSPNMKTNVNLQMSIKPEETPSDASKAKDGKATKRKDNSHPLGIPKVGSSQSRIPKVGPSSRPTTPGKGMF